MSWSDRAQLYRDSEAHREGEDLDLVVEWCAHECQPIRMEASMSSSWARVAGATSTTEPALSTAR